MRLLAIGFALALIAPSLAVAQPAQRDNRRPRPPAGAPSDVGPTEAPPSPREERVAARKGFVWIPGRWDWRGKWEWMPGHWERERAGKSWRDGRWERKDNRWVYVAGEWIGAAETSAPAATPPPRGWPTAAPPAPRDEKADVRPGFVWIAGEWDWRNDKWEWVPGHFERERAGKRWNPARWEQRDGRWTRLEGSWTDNNTPSPPPPPTDPRRSGKREWKLERPMISSYWPTKGNAGSRIVIRGKNFPANAVVEFAGQPVRAAKITADRITFTVPAGAVSGSISVRTGGQRELPVGQFEVAAAYDPVAEQRRIEEEQRKAAEAAWQTRQAQLANDRAAREAAMRKAQEERAATRERRRAERLGELAARWQRAFLADPETQDELTLHAQRVAELARAKEIAEVAANGKLVVRIGVAQAREDERHQQRMAALEVSFKARGGQP